jgi:hypothetical protein
MNGHEPPKGGHAVGDALAEGGPLRGFVDDIAGGVTALGELPKHSLLGRPQVLEGLVEEPGGKMVFGRGHRRLPEV